MSSASYAPDESYSTIIQEQTWLQGALISNFFFGIQTTLCVLTFLAVFRRSTTRFSGTRIGLLIYIAVLFAVTTAVQGFLLDWIQMGFITQRGYPGGPSAFFNNEWGNTSNVVSSILSVVANWMMDSLMVWRCYIVCNSVGRLWSIGIGISSVWLIAVFATGSLFIHSTLHSAPPAPYALAYGISTLLLNLTSTSLIAGRLLAHRRNLISRLGRGQGQRYLSIAAVVIESAAIYTSILVVVIVAYAVGSPATNFLQQVIEQVQTIASLLIILRATRGEGWTRSTESELVCSPNTHVELVPEQNVIQLRAVSTRAEESIQVLPKQDDLKRHMLFTRDAVV